MAGLKQKRFCFSEREQKKRKYHNIHISSVGERGKTSVQLAAIITISIIIKDDIGDTPLIDDIHHLISHLANSPI